MKFFITLLSLGLVTASLSQNSFTRLKDHKEYKLDLHYVDNHWAYLKFDFYNVDECILVKHSVKNDTLYLIESNDHLEWGSDVFFDKDTSLHEDSLLIKSKFHHAFMVGDLSYDGFFYIINGLRVDNLFEDDREHRAYFKRPKNDTLNIRMKYNDLLIKEYQVVLDQNYNEIQIENVDLFTNIFFSSELLDIFPFKAVIDGKEMTIVLI